MTLPMTVGRIDACSVPLVRTTRVSVISVLLALLAVPAAAQPYLYIRASGPTSAARSPRLSRRRYRADVEVRDGGHGGESPRHDDHARRLARAAGASGRRRRARRGRDPHRQEKSDSKTVHDVTVWALMRLAPGQRQALARNGNGSRYRPMPASCLCISAAAVASLAASLNNLTTLSQCTAAWAIFVPR